MRIIFVRHGEPDYANDCLTENGRLQAKATAERLKDEGINYIYSSPMGRARETASYTANLLGLEVNTLDFMHEIDWGTKKDLGDISGSKSVPHNGHPWTLAVRLYAESPESGVGDKWREHPYFRDNICIDYYDKIAKEIDSFLLGFGLERKNGYFECHEPCDETIAVFSHGGSGAAAMSQILNLPFPYVLSVLMYGVCSVSIIDFKAELNNVVIPHISLFNDMRHLGDVKKEKLRFEK